MEADVQAAAEFEGRLGPLPLRIHEHDHIALIAKRLVAVLELILHRDVHDPLGISGTGRERGDCGEHRDENGRGETTAGDHGSPGEEKRGTGNYRARPHRHNGEHGTTRPQKA
jgi:hypothetical protein